MDQSAERGKRDTFDQNKDSICLEWQQQNLDDSSEEKERGTLNRALAHGRLVLPEMSDPIGYDSGE